MMTWVAGTGVCCGSATMADKPEPIDAQRLETLVAQHTVALQKEERALVDEDAPAFVALPAPYQDVGQVARGGMGLVRRAWDPELGRHVAVKVIRPAFAADVATQERFRQEARITGQLQHPAVVPVHQLARGPEGDPIFAMKLVEGHTFSDHLRALPPPPWPPAILDEVLRILIRVCDAVAYAHAQGIVHRDLKPDNVMVGSFGQVYVMDWGIARVLPRAGGPEAPAEADAEALPVGTPGYMTPEQAMRNEGAIDERTDVYLIGAMLYEILTGRPPHVAPTLMAILYQSICGQITPPEQVAPEREPPPVLARIAMRAMEREPANRYQGVIELKADLESFMRGDERAPSRTFEPGQRILTEGGPSAEAYVIVKGRCAVFTERSGQRLVLRELGPGEVFGETAVFTGRPTSASVDAIDEVEVKIVTRESLSQSLGLHTWMGKFIQTLAERFREVDEKLRFRESRPGS
jgi:serine/threonine protein kinase